MTFVEKAIIISIVEGLTEFLPISSTAHMIFTSTILQVEKDEFIKMFQVSIQFGAILAVVALYWKKFFNFRNLNFYLKLALAVVPALVFGYLFDDAIETVLEKPVPVALVMVGGGIILLFIEKFFKNPQISDESRVTIPKAVAIGFWQCLAMMPGVSRAAASIIGGMQQKLTRSAAAEFSFFLAVPTMLAVTTYSVFLKKWNVNGIEQKGISMITADRMHLTVFIAGNLVAFVVAALAIKFFITFLKRYGFRMWGWYRIAAGLAMLAFIYLKAA